METKIVDKDGEWYLTNARFTFTDPTNGVQFEPGVHVKVTPTAWLATQEGVINKVADPFKAAEEQAAAEKAAAEKAAKEAAKAPKAGQ